MGPSPRTPNWERALVPASRKALQLVWWKSWPTKVVCEFTFFILVTGQHPMFCDCALDSSCCLHLSSLPSNHVFWGETTQNSLKQTVNECWLAWSYYLVTGMYKICQMVTQHFLQAQSGNTLKPLSHWAIEAGQENGMVRPISCFAFRHDVSWVSDASAKCSSVPRCLGAAVSKGDSLWSSLQSPQLWI